MKSKQKIVRRYNYWLILLAAVGIFSLTLSASFAQPNPYVVRSFWKNGKPIDQIIVPGKPPKIKAKVVKVPEPNPAAGINVLINVPAFTWCYGCSATSAAMIMGHYDNNGYPDMYAGPTNGGLCPMNNEIYWGHTFYPSVTCGECPLSATHEGIDGRTIDGHADDYWIDYGDPGPDPYIIYGWPEHIPGDCTADYMGTNQSKYNCSDGVTYFFFYPDGSPLYDYTGSEPTNRDGCHGMKLFVNSRGYPVTSNFSQLIYPNPVYTGITHGFTFDDFKNEIDAGRPVMIQIEGHSMVGYGYDDSSYTIYIHNTWDNSDHSMIWGGKYSGMRHYGVTVLRVKPISETYAISGKVTLSGGSSSVTEVLLTLSGDAYQTIHPDAEGNYAFPNLVAGNYTVTPSLATYVFTPDSIPYLPLNSNQTEQNYAGSPPVTISGHIKTLSRIPIRGVTLFFSNSGGSAITNSMGYYSRTLNYGWSGRVTPLKTGYTFTPAYRDYPVLTSNQTNRNYTGVPKINISGYVRTSGGAGIGGVTLFFSNSGGSAISNSMGYYSKTLNYGWSGRVTPIKTNYTFAPAYRDYPVLISNRSNQNYAGTLTR